MGAHDVVDHGGDGLAAVSAMVDAGALRGTTSKRLGTISAASLRLAHAMLEGGQARGNIVLEGLRH